ncbi:MAG: saccharopine dehydrogenase C-terminal domain-containing protein [Cyclobacteriaceae bacterium]
MGKKAILVLGAGRSSSALISYLINNASEQNWHVWVGDYVEAAARERINGSSFGTAIKFDLSDSAAARKAVKAADLVISLLPANFHPLVAKLCLEAKKHLFTASYVSDEMQAMHEDAKNNDLLFLNESGLDPGVDHMSAMKIIDEVHDKGGVLTSFESFAGGLIAPETDPENPWRYKFTWNPRNVVMAGQGTAKFIQEGHHKFISYQRLFKRTTNVHVPGFGDYQGYANRDSLKYINTYGLQGIKTMIRGTLRNDGFCDAWNVLVQLGCTDDTYQMEHVDKMTHRDFINSFLQYDEVEMVEGKLCTRLGLNVNGPEMTRLRWSGFFDAELVGLDKGTPAQILEHILNKKWKLEPQDKDMIVMWHRFLYTLGKEKREVLSSLVAIGDDAVHTAMAKGVGLPLAITAKLFLQGKIHLRGVCIPIGKSIYLPVLEELEQLGMHLQETERVIT